MINAPVSQQATPRVWSGDYQTFIEIRDTKKYHHIHLFCDLNELNGFDVFLLSSCRLHFNGQLSISINKFNISHQYILIADLIRQSSAHQFTLKSKQLGVGISCSLDFTYKDNGAVSGYEFITSGHFEKECLALFRHTFKHDISKNFWRWKYHTFPSLNIYGFKNSQLIAHYGARTCPMYFNGNEYIAAQVGDTMVDPQHRGGLKNGIFNFIVKYANSHFISKISLDASTSAYPVICFGFPHKRQMLLAKRLGNYKDGGQLLVSTFNTPDTSTDKPNLNHIRLRNPKAKQALHHGQQLWNNMAASFTDTCLIARNESYIHKRYFIHPEFDYYAIYDQNCIFILRDINNKDTYILDIICNKEQLSHHSENLRHYFYHEFPKKRLMFWSLPHHHDQYFREVSTVLDRSAALALLFLPDYSFLEKAKWWISMGDSDFL